MTRIFRFLLSVAILGFFSYLYIPTVANRYPDGFREAVTAVYLFMRLLLEMLLFTKPRFPQHQPRPTTTRTCHPHPDETCQAC